VPYVFGILAVLVFLGVVRLIPKSMGGSAGLINGQDGRLSTSKFQFVVWTGIVVFSYVALFVADTQKRPCVITTATKAPLTPAALPSESAAGSSVARTSAADAPGSSNTATSAMTLPWCPMPALPNNLLLAMGFTVITLVTAKGVTTAYVNSGRIVKTPAEASKASLADLVTGDDGNTPDLSKVQMLTWTAIASVAYLYTVIQTLPAYHGGNYFPDIDAALMALMGIGQGAYLGNKIVQSQTAIISSLNPARGALPGATVAVMGSGFGNAPGQVQFGDVVAALQPSTPGPGLQWSDTQVSFIVPPCHSNQVPFAPGENVYVALLLQGSNGATASNPVMYTF
jgi:hypothetical protein